MAARTWPPARFHGALRSRENGALPGVRSARGARCDERGDPGSVSGCRIDPGHARYQLEPRVSGREKRCGLTKYRLLYGPKRKHSGAAWAIRLHTIGLPESSFGAGAPVGGLSYNRSMQRLTLLLLA